MIRAVQGILVHVLLYSTSDGVEKMLVHRYIARTLHGDTIPLTFRPICLLATALL